MDEEGVHKGGIIIPRGWFAPGTALTLRDYLLEVGEDYPYHMWKQVTGRIQEERRRRKPYQTPTFDAFRALLQVLRHLNLIQITRVEDRAATEGVPRAVPVQIRTRRFYRVTPGRRDVNAWENPFDALYKTESFNARVTRGTKALIR